MKFEYIEWVDIISQNEWVSAEDLAVPALVKSVGIVITDNDQYIRIAGAVSTQDDITEYNAVLAIPKGCITLRKNLRIE